MNDKEHQAKIDRLKADLAKAEKDGDEVRAGRLLEILWIETGEKVSRGRPPVTATRSG